jgi:hypothetical protein
MEVFFFPTYSLHSRFCSGQNVYIFKMLLNFYMKVIIQSLQTVGIVWSAISALELSLIRHCDAISTSALHQRLGQLIRWAVPQYPIYRSCSSSLGLSLQDTEFLIPATVLLRCGDNARSGRWKRGMNCGIFLLWCSLGVRMEMNACSRTSVVTLLTWSSFQWKRIGKCWEKLMHFSSIAGYN